MSPAISGSHEGLGLPRPLDGAAFKGILATPDRFGGYARVAMGYRSRGLSEFANGALRRAMMIAPGEPRLLVNAANLWLSSGVIGDPSGVIGDPAHALRKALCLDPNLSAAIERLLLIHKASGDIPGAVRAARWLVGRGLEGRAASFLELAVLASEAGERKRAVQFLNEGIQATVRTGLDPGNLIRAAKRVGGQDAHLRTLRGLLCAAPADPIVARELASTPSLEECREIDQTKAILTRLCLALPFNAVVQNGAGVAQETLGRNKAAFERYARAAVLEPGLSIAIFNVGVRARYAGDFERAGQWFRRALTIAPRDPVYLYNLGHVLLATGHTEQGLILYEERWRSGQRRSHRRAAPDPSFAYPFWDDAATTRDREPILIWGEQGLGDEIWFAGYPARLFPDHPTVLECDPRLVDLFTRSGLAARVVPRTDPPHAATRQVARQVAAGSLPLLASTRSRGDVIEAPGGYLKADTARAAIFRDRLASLGHGPTIGVSWRSRKPVASQSFEAPLTFWRPIFEIENAIFVNLQYGVTPTELQRIHDQYGVRLACFEDMDPFHDIDDLAGLVSVLDHVVSIANLNVTLCHGLGRPCHVALRCYQEDWRFQRARSVSPWLPDCHLYWPESASDQSDRWLEVFSRIAGAISDSD